MRKVSHSFRREAPPIKVYSLKLTYCSTLLLFYWHTASSDGRVDIICYRLLESVDSWFYSGLGQTKNLIIGV